MPHRNEPEISRLHEVAYRLICPSLHALRASDGRRHSQHVTQRKALDDPEVFGVVLKPNRRAAGGTLRLTRCRTDGPITRRSAERWERTVEVEKPRPGRRREIIEQVLRIRDELVRGSRTAGALEHSDGRRRKHSRLASRRAQDPWLNIVVIHQRNTVPPIADRRNGCETMRAAISRLRVIGQQLA